MHLCGHLVHQLPKLFDQLFGYLAMLASLLAEHHQLYIVFQVAQNLADL